MPSDPHPPEVDTSTIDEAASLEETFDIVGRPHLIAEIHAGLEEMRAGRAEVLSEDDVLGALRA